MDDESLRARAAHLLRTFRESVDGEFPTGRLLVVGSGTGYNTQYFGQLFDEVHTLDVTAHDYDADVVDHTVVADGKHIPYVDDAFDLVMAISVVEHVLPLAERPKLVAELVRVTGPEGHVFMQIPNNDFLVELHTGLPFVQWLPRGEELAARLGYENLELIDIPDPEELVNWLMAANADVEAASGLVYPREAVPGFGLPYLLLDAFDAFDRMPFGWVVTASPRPTSASAANRRTRTPAPASD